MKQFIPTGVLLAFATVLLMSVTASFIMLDAEFLKVFLNPNHIFGIAQRMVFFFLAVYFQAQWIDHVKKQKKELGK